jgi:hypothetical protein
MFHSNVFHFTENEQSIQNTTMFVKVQPQMFHAIDIGSKEHLVPRRNPGAAHKIMAGMIQVSSFGVDTPQASETNDRITPGNRICGVRHGCGRNLPAGPRRTTS